MLDVGFSEILLTSAIALIVLGPERLPKVARQVGNWMGRARAMARQLSEQLEREVDAEELMKTRNRPSLPPDPPYKAPNPPDTASMVPPGAAAAGAAAPDIAAPAPAEQALPAAAAEQTYGLDASLTTPAAMHAADPPLPESQAATTDLKAP